MRLLITQNMTALYFRFSQPLLFFFGLFKHTCEQISIHATPSLELLKKYLKKYLVSFVCEIHLPLALFWLRKQWGTHNKIPSVLKRHLEVMLWRQHKDRFVEPAATPNPMSYCERLQVCSSFFFFSLHLNNLGWRKNYRSWIFHLLLAFQTDS